MGTLVGLNTVKGLHEAKQIKQNKKNDSHSMAVRCADIAENSISDVHSGSQRVREDVVVTQHANPDSAASIPVFSYHPDISISGALRFMSNTVI